ncbi:hypothetical protein THOE12_310009 [Vibrio rotiferianus]|nr:hypothetical protein THOE12_310009 [Vibrio rotiferianus]
MLIASVSYSKLRLKFLSFEYTARGESNDSFPKGTQYFKKYEQRDDIT